MEVNDKARSGSEVKYIVTEAGGGSMGPGIRQTRQGGWEGIKLRIEDGIKIGREEGGGRKERQIRGREIPRQAHDEVPSVDA